MTKLSGIKCLVEFHIWLTLILNWDRYRMVISEIPMFNVVTLQFSISDCHFCYFILNFIQNCYKDVQICKLFANNKIQLKYILKKNINLTERIMLFDKSFLFKFQYLITLKFKYFLKKIPSSLTICLIWLI